jgi:hypothetical protein
MSRLNWLTDVRPWLNAAHVAGPVRNQTLPEALERVWQGYPTGKDATK